jgi:hypothetical protein
MGLGIRPLTGSLVRYDVLSIAPMNNVYSPSLGEMSMFQLIEY